MKETGWEGGNTRWETKKGPFPCHVVPPPAPQDALHALLRAAALQSVRAPPEVLLT